MFRKLKTLGSRFVGWSYRFLLAPLWCDHAWKFERAEDIGEKAYVRISICCSKCGRRECYPDCG